MSIQLSPGVPSLDASDFQATHNGVTFGLKLRHLPTPDGSTVTSLLLVERNASGSWDFKAEIDRDFIPALEADMSAWLASALAKINLWLRQRFSDGGSAPAPGPLPSYVPAALGTLDGMLRALKTEIVAGVPQVKA
jgi:hypothetical protein